ncbi:MAG: sel1 repeat family protein [Magnetococcales bacterium]|nr:sel1 repeat family protein [Magnetococcales bacterium]
MIGKKGFYGLFLATLLAAGTAWASPEDDYKEGIKAQSRDDLQTAMSSFKRAAEAGHTRAMARLAIILDRAEENDAALVWFRKAADAGEAAGFLGIGVMMTNGDAGPKKEKEGLAMIEKAASMQYGPAMLVLAKVHLLGEFNQTPDLNKALSLLEKSADLGYVPAMKELARLYKAGTPDMKPDAAKAKSWEEKVKQSPNKKSDDL